VETELFKSNGDETAKQDERSDSSASSGLKVENCPRKCVQLSSDNRNGASEDSDESDSWATLVIWLSTSGSGSRKDSEASRGVLGVLSYLAGEDVRSLFFCLLFCFLGVWERFKDALVASNAAAAARRFLGSGKAVGSGGMILRAGLWVFIYNL
jgi:hypothetical protein